MGAYYTPLPVVRFIVRSVDHILKTEFGLADGLADTAKLPDGRHKVQVLDPAVGTGTFISAVIRNIYEQLIAQGQKGRWPAYVHHDLLPRIHGFELMMAAYTIAHLKLSIAFKQTGFTIFNKRLGIYLTNSLEQAEPQTDIFSLGFAQSIAEEAKQAAVIKNETPIMIVLGNPPYSGESSNTFYTGHDVYKVEPGGKEKLKERNSKWINDDYVKFIRLAESMIQKNGEGVVAMITAHGYLDNPTFRGMRWHLMKTFTEIYVLDLHGNSKKKEKASDGSKDENVFDIQQGVAILIAIKHKDKGDKELSNIFCADYTGPRAAKFAFLEKNFQAIEWQKTIPSAPNYEWRVRDTEALGQYQEGFSVQDLFQVSSVGIVTARDAMSLQWTRQDIERVVSDFQESPEEELRTKYDLGKDARDWKVSLAKKDVIKSYDEKRFVQMTYRPFDLRWTFYTGNSKGFHCMPRNEVMQHLLSAKNYALVVPKQLPDGEAGGAYVTKNIGGHKSFCAYNINYYFPLYLCHENGEHTLNFNKKVLDKISGSIGESTPEQIFDYIYAVLNSATYTKKWREFLKSDFPRVPYPKDKKQFVVLAALGKELRELHLLESPKVRKYITSYPESGSNIVEKIARKGGDVYINTEQYFGDVPEVAWNFYIGGYQPAQKWLKDRRGRALANDDIEHYQKIIVALIETDRIMREIDAIE